MYAKVEIENFYVSTFLVSNRDVVFENGFAYYHQLEVENTFDQDSAYLNHSFLAISPIFF